MRLLPLLYILVIAQKQEHGYYNLSDTTLMNGYAAANAQNYLGTLSVNDFVLI